MPRGIQYPKDMEGDLRDVQMRLQAALNQIEKLSYIIDQLPYMVILADSSGIIEYINSQLTAITGFYPEDVLGKELKMFKSPQISDSDYQRIWEDLQKGESWSAELENRKKDGNIYLERVSILPVINREGRIIYYMKVAEELAEIKDVLTSLPNRNMFRRKLEQAIIQGKEDKQQLAVLFLDIDRFKSVNDTLGHDAGDMLLKEVALRINNMLRPCDYLARFGGDEFLVLFGAMNNPKEASAFAESVIRRFEDNFSFKERQLHITISIGVSIFPDDGDDFEMLIQKADFAMYAAKEAGRNNYQVFIPAFRDRFVPSQ